MAIQLQPLTNAILGILRAEFKCYCCSWTRGTLPALITGLKGTPVAQRTWSQAGYRKRSSGTWYCGKSEQKNINDRFILFNKDFQINLKQP